MLLKTGDVWLSTRYRVLRQAPDGWGSRSHHLLACKMYGGYIQQYGRGDTRIPTSLHV